MNEEAYGFLSDLISSQGTASIGFSIAEFLISISLSAFLSMFIAVIYKKTHSGLSYSRTFVLTMIIMSITVSFIMLIIGSNLARAFSLVGALSIIRFRNAVKDSRDTGFIFLTMAIGMACGTKIYIMAVLFTIISSIIFIILDKYYFGSNVKEERLIQFSFPEDIKISTLIEKTLLNNFRNRTSLLSSEILDSKKVLVYSIEIQKDALDDNVIDGFRTLSDQLDVKLLTGFEKFNF
jgi:uncharacterized membrane protein YhiD involved in acid resistance